MAADGVLYIFPASTSVNVKEPKNQVKRGNETRDEQLLNVRGDQCHGTMLKADLFICADLTPGPHLMICLKSQAIESRVEHGQS